MSRPTPPAYMTPFMRDAYSKGWASAGRGTDQWAGRDSFAHANRQAGTFELRAWEHGHQDRREGKEKWHTPNETARRAAEMTRTKETTP